MLSTKPTTIATTTITSDPGILCFHHCSVKVFCFVLPTICPECEAELDANRLLPFRLPYPFVRAAQYPCAIVLRPTTGDFLNDYNNATDLHIAVTTSSGCIVEFDRDGLQRRRADNMSAWWQCLLVGDVPEPWYDLWDSVLLQTCKQPARWTIDSYHEDAHNCYTFVLSFLQALDYDKLSEAARSKTSFCEKYIVPRTTTAGKYISLYRKLREAGIYVHPHPHSKQQQQHNQHQHQKQQPQQKHCKSKQLSSASSISTTASVATAASSSSSSSPTNNITIRAPTLCTIDE